MIFLYGFLLVAGGLTITALSFPVRIRLESSLVFLIQWIFLKVRIVVGQDSVQAELELFSRKFDLSKKKTEEKPPKKEKKKKEKKKAKKPKKKMTFSMVMDILQDSVVKKLLFLVVRLVVRFMASIRIKFLKGNIGLKDYYWQGIAMGLLAGLPKTDNFRIDGNFEEINHFILIISISLWKVLSAIVLFLICFPYLKTLRLYLKIR
ncbi:MAG: hypothetical protein GY866_19975 [Proteobacteria bacterium]|nr:hypothetical protein [Pseudomonadota bacterium]